MMRQIAAMMFRIRPVMKADLSLPSPQPQRHTLAPMMRRMPPTKPAHPPATARMMVIMLAQMT
jgi:hypothetical protein